MTERGSGQTTSQLQAAEQGAVFVWCNDQLDYPMALARHVRRADLIIVGREWLSRLSLDSPGGPRSGVVIDHAFEGWTAREIRSRQILELSGRLR